MQAALQESERKRAKLEDDHQHVRNMFEEGLLKVGENGQYEAVRDPAETEMIK